MGNKRKTQKSSGITLIALVVTIVVLLILAGVSINLVIGQNGIINKAVDASDKTKMAEAKDKVAVMLGEYQIEKYTGTTTLGDFLNKNKEAGEIDEVTETTDGYEIEKDGYIITIDKDGNIVGEPEKTGPRPQISNIKVVEDSNGAGEGLGEKEANEGDTLYITFTHSIEGGTTTVSPALPFAVTANGKYTFTVTGTVNGEAKTKDVTVTVNQFASAYKIGDLVNYTYDSAANYTKLTSETCGSSSNPTEGIPQTTGLQWKILNIDEETGKIDLVSATPTSTSVYFSGAKGYNNGVYLLNDICAQQYSNSVLGITARSINLEDIEKHLTTTENGGLAKRAAYNNGTATYGTPKTYKGSYSKYPKLYESQLGAGMARTDFTKTVTQPTDFTIANLDPYKESGNGYTTPNTTDTYLGGGTSDTLTVTQTYYGGSTDFSFTSNNSSGVKSFDEAGAVLNSSNYYWVASRYALCRSDNAYFGLRRAYAYVDYSRLFVSDGLEDYRNASNRLRPLVSLDSSLLTGTKTDGAWDLKTE